MAPTHQGGHLKINKVTMPGSPTVDISKQGVSTLPLKTPALPALIDQDLVAIRSKMLSLGHIEAPKMFMTPSSTVPPTSTWSRSTQPTTFTAQPNSKQSTTITASKITAISTIASTSATTTCTDTEATTEAQNTFHPPGPNPNGLQILCVISALILTIGLVWIARKLWKVVKKYIAKEPDMKPYATSHCSEPQPTLDRNHKRFASNSSFNTNSRAEQSQLDVPSPTYVSTSRCQDRNGAPTVLSSPDRVNPAELQTPSPRPPAYSENA